MTIILTIIFLYLKIFKYLENKTKTCSTIHIYEEDYLLKLKEIEQEDNK